MKLPTDVKLLSVRIAEMAEPATESARELCRGCKAPIWVAVSSRRSHPEAEAWCGVCVVEVAKLAKFYRRGRA